MRDTARQVVRNMISAPYRWLTIHRPCKPAPPSRWPSPPFQGAGHLPRRSSVFRGTGGSSRRRLLRCRSACFPVADLQPLVPLAELADRVRQDLLRLRQRGKPRLFPLDRDVPEVPYAAQAAEEV